jgi:LysR family transcriptional regulator, low CO2-responsive transcriptional regulator
MAHTHQYKDLQLPQLRSFCLAAARGNFTSAAETLGLSVSAVWQQVRALERQMGATLLRRRGRAVELTADGQMLLELIQPHLSGLDSLGRLFEARRQQLPQQVSVAATEYLLSYDLSKAIQEFTAAHPTVRLSLRADIPRAVARMVEQGDVDVGIMPYDRDEPRSPTLEYRDLFERHFSLLASARHPLARKKRLVADDLAGYPMIMPPRGSHSYRMLERLLQRHELVQRIHVLMESRTVGVVCHYAALGLGIALLYVGPEICQFLPDLHLRPFDRQLETLPVALVVRRGAHLAEPVQWFCQTICRLLANTAGSPKK